MDDLGLSLTLPVCDVPTLCKFSEGVGSSTVSVAEVSFVDDGAFPIMDPSPSKLVEKLRSLVALVYRVMVSHGLLPNFKPGKTEAIMKLRGEGTKKVMESLRSYTSEVYELPVPEIGETLRITPTYKHLGTMTNPLGTMGPEIQHRNKSHLDTLALLKKSVFRVTHLPVATKLMFAESLAQPKLFYNCEIWDHLTQPQINMLDSALGRRYRSVLGKSRLNQGQLPPADEVAAEVGKPVALEVLRRQRLMYLPRLLNGAPKALLALLQADSHYPDSFFNRIVADFE